MRILQLHNQHEGRGGADDVLEHEAAILTRGGHTVDQLLVGAAGTSNQGPIAMAAAAVWNRKVNAQLREHVARFRPEVVHVHTPFPTMSPAVFRTASRLGCATVTTAHSYRYSCIKGTLVRDGGICEDCVGSQMKLSGVRHRCYHDSLAASAALTVSLNLHKRIGTFVDDVDRFVTLTPFARDLLARDGVDPQHITVKPNAVEDPGEPTTPPSRRGGAVVFVGRLVEEKGVRTLLDAWAQTSTESTLHIAGDGPLRELVEVAQEHGRVRYEGWLVDEAVGALLSTAALVVVPSQWYEAGPPLVLLRALAAGAAVLCSDLDNICSSVLEAGAGTSFATGSVPALSRALDLALEDPSLLDRRGQAGRRLYLSAHTPEATLKGLEGLYADALARRRSRRSSADTATTSTTPGDGQ